MTQKELITRLIKDDLIHHCLIVNFESIGFYCDNYCLDLSDTIFKYLKIEGDELYEKYLEKCKEAAEQNIYMDRKVLSGKAEHIYNFLIFNIGPRWKGVEL
jgi:hypothetical protein